MQTKIAARQSVDRKRYWCSCKSGFPFVWLSLVLRSLSVLLKMRVHPRRKKCLHLVTRRGLCFSSFPIFPPLPRSPPTTTRSTRLQHHVPLSIALLCLLLSSPHIHPLAPKQKGRGSTQLVNFDSSSSPSSTLLSSHYSSYNHHTYRYPFRCLISAGSYP